MKKSALKKSFKSAPATPRLYLEVLQNGATLATTNTKLKRASSICLSTNNGALKIPFYPLSGDVEVVRIEDGAAYLRLNLQCEGFVASKTNFRIIHAHQKENLEPVKLHDGDYGAINYYGLKVLFRLTSKNPVSTTENATTQKLRRLYTGTAKSFIYDTPGGGIASGAAVIISTLLMGALTLGFLSRPTQNGQDKESLPAVYKLPFVANEHIKILPEVLQQKLSRPNMLNQTMVYYRELASLLSGTENEPKLVSKDTYMLYQEIYEHQRQKIDGQRESQKKLDDKNLRLAGSALVMVPSVHGESFDRTAERVRNKISLHDRTHEFNLSLRRSNTTKYLNEKEESYLFQDYKNKGGRNPKEKRELQESLAKIKPFHLMTDEEAMYFEADQLAKAAKAAKDRLDKMSNIADEAISKPELTFAPPFAAATFIAPNNWREVDAKFSQIVASEYGVARKEPIKEPLIGQLDPKLVERVINQKKFELQLCYDVALRRNQGINGTMAWQWRLDSRGILSDLTLTNTEIKDDRMIDCVRERIARWKFPRPTRGSVEIQYPFTFRKARG